VPIRHATGPVHEITHKLLGERFSYIEVGRFVNREEAVLQALHEFESQYGVTIEEFHFDPLVYVCGSFRLFLKHTVIKNHKVSFPIHSY